LTDFLQSRKKHLKGNHNEKFVGTLRLFDSNSGRVRCPRNAPAIPDPFRQAGGRYWDLRPLGHPDYVKEFFRPPKEFASWKIFRDMKVSQVTKEGLLIAFYDGSGKFFIRNHPQADKVVDGERLKYFFALRLSENFQYRTVLAPGDRRSIRLRHSL